MSASVSGDSEPNAVNPGLTLESMGVYATPPKSSKLEPPLTLANLNPYDNSAVKAILQGQTQQARAEPNQPQHDDPFPHTPRKRTETIVLDPENSPPPPTSSGTLEQLKRRSAVDEDSRVGEIQKTIKNPRAKKAFLGTVFIFASVLKTALNFPVLKQIWKVTSLVGEGGGMFLGTIIGAALLNPELGAKIGGKIGKSVLNPASILGLNKMYKMGDSYLSELGLSVGDRMRLHNATNFNIKSAQGRLEFFEKELKKTLVDACVSSGHSKKDAKTLADRWLLAVKNDYKWQKLPPPPPSKPKDLIRPEQWADQIKDWEHKKNMNIKVWENQHEINVCLKDKKSLDKILLHYSQTIPEDQSGPNIMQQLNKLMKETSGASLKKTELEPYLKIDDALRAATTPSTLFTEVKGKDLQDPKKN